MENTPKEWALLQKIRDRVLRQDANTVVGLGDDAFVFRNFPGYSVLCQDMLVEENHFRLPWTSATDLGHKSLAVSLSDIAAMGAMPHYAQISLALPKNITENWLDDFYKGMCELADQHGCRIVGGDLTSGEKLTIDVSLHGSCEKPLTRKGAQPGDVLLVSGPLGLSHTGLLALQQNRHDFPAALRAHTRPTPRLDLVPLLQKNSEHVHALMDCSDGLVNDVFHLTRHSDFSKAKSEPLPALGIEFDLTKFDIHEETSRFANAFNMTIEDFILWGGEDYQLLLVTTPEDASYFKDFKAIGKFIDKPGVFLQDYGARKEIKSFKGWRHF